MYMLHLKYTATITNLTVFSQRAQFYKLPTTVAKITPEPVKNGNGATSEVEKNGAAEAKH